ncbi:VWA domain-containing protein [Rhizobium sp. XQZ8]|uniref:vWA domain-containing protein n=1 Tax=Rhizobium populisoli TaxID=2859785 RepID=UPI001CA50996|nr:vWA domain-containing protein [Rhizobium populisoli]MBW6424852.1 VWA domain-containing protein [Rhizobium populisoli]
MSNTEQPDQQTPPAPENPDVTLTSSATGPTSPAPEERPVEATTDAPVFTAGNQAPQERPKTKGVADIVFLIDITGSMAPCVDALRRNIEAFIDTLSKGDPNNAAPVKDWRGKVVGYRDIEAAEAEGLPWIVDNDFVRDAGALKAQLGTLQANGGGDEPESLLDALYKLASMEAVAKNSQTEDPTKWRYRSDAARVVIVFTDASFKETMSIAEAKGGSLQDVANLIMANRIILSLFAPNFEGYDRLSQIDKSEWEVVEYDGLNPQEALQKFTSDPVNFRNTLKQLAASVSRSAATVAL